ncbi:hypothetical protein BCR37DRAFT_116499 [Protomyces lactucae-debilis]|uniref:Uncharacterized protein n=1 Tax=Protomyces lactucae-debilis TaxID=2754530 RepID=A0A1Y2F2V8_PROLT|nr:uncharacterized protein BCR37DRAFT_116499 [Protomyces lactucae-debilis]ORY78211.1 hypothetical protein BCR37DRAFT_116499 [Protomyces lactucae-debilis]
MIRKRQGDLTASPMTEFASSLMQMMEEVATIRIAYATHRWQSCGTGKKQIAFPKTLLQNGAARMTSMIGVFFRGLGKKLARLSLVVISRTHVSAIMPRPTSHPHSAVSDTAFRCPTSTFYILRYSLCTTTTTESIFSARYHGITRSASSTSCLLSSGSSPLFLILTSIHLFASGVVWLDATRSLWAWTLPLVFLASSSSPMKTKGQLSSFSFTIFVHR